MELELLEDLALADDRDAVLGRLLPGSADHDYHRCLAHQHRGELDDAQRLVDAWPRRHPDDDRGERLRVRQVLLRAARDPGAARADLEALLGPDLDHTPEPGVVDPSLASALPAGAFDGQALLREAVAQRPDLALVTDEGLVELLDGAVPEAARAPLLARLGHAPAPAMVGLVVAELARRGLGAALPLAGALTLAQLEAVAEARPELRGHGAWLAAVLRRMRPPRDVDLALDGEARRAHLAALRRFVEGLPSSCNSLRACVLWHVLDDARRRDAVDLEALAAYLALPRQARYAGRTLREWPRRDELADLSRDFREETGLAPVGDDEPLVRACLQRLVAEGRDVEPFAGLLERAWFDAEIAAARLLAGAPGADAATERLGPTRAAALRDAVEIAWCAHNPALLPAEAAVVLDADVKNVAELIVKVFRIDPVAYYQLHRREVGLDVDLDGLSPTHEQRLRLDAPPIRRQRRRVELPACARPGVYVVELIGGGTASRALITKGRLREVTEVDADGHLVTILDEAGAPCPGARAWLDEREHVADAEGRVRLPFTTAPRQAAALLVAGDVATVRALDLVEERASLTASVHVEREALAADRAVRALLRLRLTVGGAPADLGRLIRPTWELALVDHHGVATTRTQPLDLDDDDAAVLAWTMPPEIARVTIRIRASIAVPSQQREQALEAEASVAPGGLAGSHQLEAAYLSRTPAGLVLRVLGRGGEPRPRRPVSVALVHRYANLERRVELATDDDGRIELGALPGLARLGVALGEHAQAWAFDDGPAPRALHVEAGQPARVPLPPGRTAAEAARRASLVELRGGLPARHVALAPELLEGALAYRGLAPGEYALRAPGLGEVALVVAAGVRRGDDLVAPRERVRLTGRAPVLAALAADDDALRVRVADAGPRTRVHVVATRFAAEPALAARGEPPRPGAIIPDRPAPLAYASGRELGDELRYVLDRRGARRFPGLLLDRPTLLLNPWERRASATATADARPGGWYGAAPAPAAAPRRAGAWDDGAGGGDAARPGHDFLRDAPIVLANLVPDAEGRVEVPRAALGDATCATILCDDPALATTRHLALPEGGLAVRDLCLRRALRPDQHALQRKALRPLRPGEALVVEDVATAQVHLVDSVARAHAYLLGLGDDAELREADFVARWHELDDDARRERYDRHACHELHLFLYFKDRPFFDARVRPYLASKRRKEFLDRWLLDEDLGAYLAPGGAARLNALERALLAWRAGDDARARLLADEVAAQPPDPERDARLLDALLGGAVLEGDGGPAAAAMAEVAADATGAFAPAEAEAEAEEGAARGPRLKIAAPKRAKRAGPPGGGGPPRSEEAADARFRALDRTQELAERGWWRRRPAECGPDLIPPSRLWRDLAAHRGPGFLSPALGLAAGSFAEAMCALAVSDLPLVPGAHAAVRAGARLELTAASPALAGTAELVDGAWPPAGDGPALVVGQAYVRDDDRHRWVDGEQRDHHVDGPLSAGVVYACQVVVANPTGARQRVAVLVQIPEGSIAVGDGRATRTLELDLPAYGTHGHEYAFYFPAPGTYGHFPAHASRGGALVAAAPGRTLEVVATGAAPDLASWAHVSQHGTTAEVVAHLAAANLATLDLTRCAWRLRERDAFEAIVGALEARAAFSEPLWAYALVHGDRARLAAWLRAHADQLAVAGPALETALVTLDAEDLGAYEHLEFAPLVNARAHRLGPSRRILNAGLAAQYAAFLELVAHRPRPTAEDLLAATTYLLAQDQHARALAAFDRVDPAAVAGRLQHAYLDAWIACLRGDLDRAEAIARAPRALPSARWAQRFAALAAMLAEARGDAAVVTDPQSRAQRLAALAAAQPTFELQVDRDGIVLRAQRVAELELRFLELDVELLFSRQPFAQGDATRLSFVEPSHRERLVAPAAEQRVPWPAGLRGRNLIVEAVAGGVRRAVVHHASDLAVTTAHHAGQVRVARASDGAPRRAAYVKAYARRQDGTVAFYKDGYTDLRGWFDYATLSTDDLDRVERFALLVVDDEAGSQIVEVGPPGR